MGKGLDIGKFAELKKNKKKITMLTCYDYSFASILESTSLDSILVGDSLGNVFQGNSDTLSVTIEDILYHTKAVRKGSPNIFLIADMPFLSYGVSVEKSIKNAGLLLKEGGANAVKVEGADSKTLSHIEEIVKTGIPVVGHIGLTPQRINELGGYKVQGKNSKASFLLVSYAKALEKAGAFMVVVECVPSNVGKLISGAVKIPVIGIGAGSDVDGQVLVINDMLGITPSPPKFVKTYSKLRDTVSSSVSSFLSEVRDKKFPSKENEY